MRSRLVQTLNKKFVVLATVALLAVLSASQLGAFEDCWKLESEDCEICTGWLSTIYPGSLSCNICGCDGGGFEISEENPGACDCLGISIPGYGGSIKIAMLVTPGESGARTQINGCFKKQTCAKIHHCRTSCAAVYEIVGGEWVYAGQSECVSYNPASEFLVKCCVDGLAGNSCSTPTL